MVQDAIKASLADNTATSRDFWSNSRDFCFSDKPARPTDAEAAQIAALPSIQRTAAPRGVSSAEPFYEAGTEKGKAQIKRLNEVMAAMKAKDKLTLEEVVEMTDAALPFMRTVEAAALARGVKVNIPPKSSVSYSYSTHCLQVDAPAVGVAVSPRVHRAVGQDRPVGFYPASVLIPREAQELYAGIINYESTHPESRLLIHTLLWGIRGADLQPPPINPTSEQIRILDEAVPDGARKYAAYVQLAQHPERQAPHDLNSDADSTGNGLMTIDRAKSQLLRHHLDTLTINHGTANPFDPANVETILKRLTNPGTIPEFETQPRDQVAQAGRTATFVTKVNGSGLKYQWQFNDKDLPEATFASLSVLATNDTVGIYQLMVSTEGVTVKSDRVRLTLARSTRTDDSTSERTDPHNNTPAREQTRPDTDDRIYNSDPYGAGAQNADPYGAAASSSDPYGTPPSRSTRVARGQGASTGENVPPATSSPRVSSQGDASLLAPGIAGEGRQNSLSDGKITISNSTDKDFAFDPTAYVVATSEPCQPSSIGPIGLTTSRPSEQSEKEAKDIVQKFASDWKAMGDKGLFDDVLSKISGVSQWFASETMKNIVRSTPWVGTGISAWEAITGKDAFTGDKLSNLERAAAALGTVPGVRGFLAATKDLLLAAKYAKLLNRLPAQRKVINAVIEGSAKSVESASDYSKSLQGKAIEVFQRGFEFADITDKVMKEKYSEAGDKAASMAYDKWLTHTMEKSYGASLGGMLSDISAGILRRMKK